MAVGKPVTLTQRAAVAGERTPEPLVVVGSLPVPAGDVVALTVVPGTFADEAAVQTYLNTLVTEIKSSPYFS
jgi:hypothetical protein